MRNCERWVCIAIVLLPALAIAAPSGGGPARAFTPADVEGLVLWVAADAGVTTDRAGRVAAWADRSAGKNHFTQKIADRQPVLVAGAAGGRPAIRFDGVDDALVLGKPIDPAGKSVFIVVRWGAVRGYSFAIGCNAGSDGYLRMLEQKVLVTGGNYPRIYQNRIAVPKAPYPSGGDRKPFHYVPQSLTQWNVYAITDNPATKEAIKFLGRNEHNNTPGNRFAGEIAEMAVYNRPLAAAQRRQVEQYLGAKYLRWPVAGPVPLVRVGAPVPAAAKACWAVDPRGSSRGVLFHGQTSTRLGPGRYRLRYRLHRKGLDPRTQVVLRVNDIVRTLGPADRSYDFRVPVGAPEVPAFVRLSWTRKPGRGAPVTRPATAPASGPATRPAPIPPDSLPGRPRVLAVRDIRIEVLPAVFCKSVRVDKSLYEPAQAARAEVVVANVSATDATVELRLREVTELVDTRPLASRRVAVPADSEVTVTVGFKVGTVEYGRHLVAEIVRDGKVAATAAEPFSVADNLWKVCLGSKGGGPIAASAIYTNKQIVAQMDRRRRAYCNWFEKSFWAPDDWGDLTPPAGATWFSCQARRHENTAKLKLQIDAAHARGIRAITYGKCMAGGVPGWEMARRRPAWFTVDLYGRTMGRPGDVWDMDHWQQDRYKYGDFKYIWTYRWVDLRQIDALDHGIDELIASTKQFGWDGVRFDSGGFRAHWVDGRFNGHDAVNTRNMKRMKRRVWEVLPKFLFGYNTNNPASADGREYPLSPADPIAHEVREMLAGGGLWMGEALRSRVMRNGRVLYRTWSRFARDEVRCIRTVKQYGGHFCYSYGLGRGGSARDRYKFVIGTMIGAHQYVGAHMVAPGSADWGRFLTRWSGLFWDHRLRPATDAVTVAGPRMPWWKPFVNQRVIDPKRRHVIVNLLNPPLDDKVAATVEKLPAPLNGAAVTLTLPPGQTCRRVWFVSPGRPNRAHEIPWTAKGDALTAAVPTFDSWAMIVWELGGDFAIPPRRPRLTEPLSPAELAELARTQLRPLEKLPFFDNRPPAVTANVATADDLTNPKPQHNPRVKLRTFGKATVATPKGLAVGGKGGRDVLVVQGFYHQHYRAVEAIRQADPDARVATCTARNLPPKHKDLYAYDVVVLVNMGAEAWDADGHKRLADYVEAGGRLVVLGGPFTLGQGFFRGTELERVLPVRVRPGRDVYRLPKPLPLGDRKGRAFPGRAMLYYYHAVTPTDGAEATLWAGDLPVLWQRRVGRGTSAVFVGTVLGEAGKGQTPFWQWGRWPGLAGRLILGN